jgi:hypothetical protein
MRRQRIEKIKSFRSDHRKEEHESTKHTKPAGGISRVARTRVPTGKRAAAVTDVGEAPNDENPPKPAGAAAGKVVVCAADGAAAPNGLPNAGAGAAKPNAAGAGAPTVVDDGGDDDTLLNPNVAAAGAGAGDATFEF